MLQNESSSPCQVAPISSSLFGFPLHLFQNIQLIYIYIYIYQNIYISNPPPHDSEDTGYPCTRILHLVGCVPSPFYIWKTQNELYRIYRHVCPFHCRKSVGITLTATIKPTRIPVDPRKPTLASISGNLERTH